MIDAALLAERLGLLRERIARAAARSGRAAHEITIIGVTKTHQAPLVKLAFAAGLTDVGENRVQEAATKIASLHEEYPQARWHLIGHLQRNKARRAASLFQMIHSVDDLRLAEALNRALTEQAAAQRLPILLQVNVAGEESKEGFHLPGGTASPHWPAFLESARQIAALPMLDVQGLMTIAPFSPDLEGVVRPCFRSLRLVRDSLIEQVPASAWQQLSMGMSGDVELAIEEGATLVRVGTALFGPR